MASRKQTLLPAGTPIPSTSGIYAIWFDGLDRCYIGSSKNIARRVAQHLYEMRHHCHKMNADLKRMGEGAIYAGVIELIDDLDELPEAETYWMNDYMDGGWKLYNSELRGKPHRDRMVMR